MADRILIAGGGTMGAGIAFVAAKAGYDVEIVEPQEAARERALLEIVRQAERSDDPSIGRRIVCAHGIPPRSDAMLAIEAVSERFEVKREVLAALAEALPRDALLATNTSSLSVGELADAVPHPERVLGLHFFNPPVRMALVEIVRAPQTGDDALARAFEIVERLGKTAVLAADTPGFIVNRVARPYYLQAMRALERGVASVEELDALARAVGFRMGPFELIDLIGLDVNLATSESIYERTQAPRFEPVELQRGMVAEGLLGRKSGAGFYSYRDGKAERFELDVPAPEREQNDEEIVAIVGFGNRADELAEMVAQGYRNVRRIDNDELLDELAAEATMLIDAGDGSSDRGDVIARLEASLEPECVILTDAYATNVAACAARLRHPERLAGFGVLGSLSAVDAVEIVNSQNASDDTLELAQELFATIGRAPVLVEDVPGLFLGRTVGSIVNEAMIAVAEEVATPEDIDEAMRLGANYPLGPIAWGREIGGARLRRILKRLGDAEGDGFAAHRSIWLLDMEESAEPEESLQQ
ncbi:MAG: 3-hydroxyacyl-CoA dehydrogenase NAD-binding domain-containing protein [Candidatus Cybelea sp.]